MTSVFQRRTRGDPSPVCRLTNLLDSSCLGNRGKHESMGPNRRGKRLSLLFIWMHTAKLERIRRMRVVQSRSVRPGSLSFPGKALRIARKNPEKE